MTDPDTTPTASKPCAAVARAEGGAASGTHLDLTRVQRVLAAATAAAILLSGLNALVQVMRVVVECWR